MFGRKWRYFEMFFAFLFGELSTFRQCEDVSVRFTLYKFMKKLGLKGKDA